MRTFSIVPCLYLVATIAVARPLHQEGHSTAVRLERRVDLVECKTEGDSLIATIDEIDQLTGVAPDNLTKTKFLMETSAWEHSLALSKVSKEVADQIPLQGPGSFNIIFFDGIDPDQRVASGTQLEFAEQIVALADCLRTNYQGDI